MSTMMMTLAASPPLLRAKSEVTTIDFGDIVYNAIWGGFRSMQYLHDVDDRLFPDPPNTTRWPARVVKFLVGLDRSPSEASIGLHWWNVTAVARSLLSMSSQSFFYQHTWVRDVCE
jgi:hypothetical protein